MALKQPTGISNQVLIIGVIGIGLANAFVLGNAWLAPPSWNLYLLAIPLTQCVLVAAWAGDSKVNLGMRFAATFVAMLVSWKLLQHLSGDPFESMLMALWMLALTWIVGIVFTGTRANRIREELRNSREKDRAAFECYVSSDTQNPCRAAGGVGNRAFSEISGGGQCAPDALEAPDAPRPSLPPRIRLNGSIRPLPNFVREGFDCKNLHELKTWRDHARFDLKTMLMLTLAAGLAFAFIQFGRIHWRWSIDDLRFRELVMFSLLGLLTGIESLTCMGILDATRLRQRFFRVALHLIVLVACSLLFSFCVTPNSLATSVQETLTLWLSSNVGIASVVIAGRWLSTQFTQELPHE